MLQTFTFPRRFASLHAHVWAFAKVMARLVRARSFHDFGSLLLSYFVNDEDDRLAGIFTLTHKAIDIPA